MKFPLRYASVALAGISALLSSCTTSKPKTPAPLPKPAFVMYQWNDEAAKQPGGASIKIYLDQQKAYFYKGKHQVGWTYVATGLPGHPTPTGTFTIKEKKVDKISNLYGKLLDFDGNVVQSDFNLAKETLPEGCQFAPARMPLYMRLKDDGTGMHVGNIPRPGRPASHGCIRLPRVMAERFFSHTSVGTPVTIHANGPSQDMAGTEASKPKRSGGWFNRS